MLPAPAERSWNLVAMASHPMSGSTPLGVSPTGWDWAIRSRPVSRAGASGRPLHDRGKGHFGNERAAGPAAGVVRGSAIE